VAVHSELSRTIEAVHAAGLDPDRWPSALAEVKGAVGGIAATLETFDRRTAKLIEFRSYGLPPANELAYLADEAERNPRIPALINGKAGRLVTDYSVLDERAMKRHPFYAGFLAPVGYRYFIGATLEVSAREASLFSVQRATGQGHVGAREVALMRVLAPHVRQALEVTRRLRVARTVVRSLEGALDWLADGAALVDRDGRLLYVNETLRRIAGRDDGIRIVRGHLEFSAADVSTGVARALASVHALHDGGLQLAACDFSVPRSSGAPAYLLSVRSLARPAREEAMDDRAAAIVFVRDPLRQEQSSIAMLREVFGFTPAEAGLARALQAGTSVSEYAREQHLSLNTIYGYLRGIKQKTQTGRLAELVRKLNDILLPLRDR
jgi:DNA-binding CsgD family transcriptional regulator/PAS domain-containing protein